jgi:RNA polymerase sigma-70 factor, ECF subfamily
LSNAAALPSSRSGSSRRFGPWRSHESLSEATVRVGLVKQRTRVPAAASAPTPILDAESQEWLRSLRAEGASRDKAVARLHALLLRAARFEVARRRPTLPHLRGDKLDDIALEAADDALMSVLARLESFRGASRFTTWVYKFALLEAAVKLRKRAWQGREIPLEPESWSLFSGRTPSSSKASCSRLSGRRSPRC